MHKGSKKTYYRCYAESEDAVLIAAYVDKLSAPDELPDVTNFLRFDINEGWSQGWAESTHVRDHFRTPDGDKSVVAVSDDGKLYRPRDGKKSGGISKKKLTGMQGATNADNFVIICGFNGQFYTSENGRDFELASKKFQRAVPNPETSPIEELIKWAKAVIHYSAAAALTDTDFIIVGSDGAIVHFDGDYNDAKLDIPISLTSAFADKTASEYLIAGHSPAGFVSVGHPERSFDMIYHGNDDQLFVSILRFNEEIYVADASKVCGGVYTVDASGIKETAFSDFETFGPARDLRISGSVLWALFENAVVRFDGKAWNSFAHPEDL